jgi:hypothetical protein
MGAITLTNFGGIYPRTSRRLLPDGAAQVAVNCRLSTGELVPFNVPQKIGSTSKTGPFSTLYRANENGSYAWFSWAEKVDVVKAPLFGAAKWCWTGEYEPRIATLAMAQSGGGNTYPNTSYMLGIPSPQAAPTATPSGGTGVTEDRYYAYTFISDWEEEGGVSPLSTLVNGKVDATWAIANMDAAPTNSGTGTATFGSGKTTFANTGNHWLRVGEYVVIGGDTVPVTDITDATHFKVAGDYNTETAWTRKTPWNTCTKNLYRTTGNNKQFQLVAEKISGTTYNDTLRDDQIPGDELITSDWTLPPVDLKGLRLLPSGALCGFSGNEEWFSEPYQPHAWPSSYCLTTDYPIVANESFGTGIAVATESKPFIINGVEPGQMSGQHWEEVLPGMSSRSMVGVGDMAIYASPFGLIAVSGAGCQNFSLPYFTKHEFDEYAPDTMHCVYAERRLYVHYNNGTGRCLIFNMTGDNASLTEAHFDADTLYADAITGRLYFSVDNSVYEFDPLDGYTMSQDWMSKEIVLPKPMNLGAAKVNFDLAIDPVVKAALEAERTAIAAANAPILATGKVHGAWNAKRYNTELWNGSDLTSVPPSPPDNTLTFHLYTTNKMGERTLRATKVVTEPKPFNLPSGYKNTTLMVRVISQCPIKSIELAQTKQGLSES